VDPVPDPLLLRESSKMGDKEQWQTVDFQGEEVSILGGQSTGHSKQKCTSILRHSPILGTGKFPWTDRLVEWRRERVS
jgi:hypothetical protein